MVKKKRKKKKANHKYKLLEIDGYIIVKIYLIVLSIITDLNNGFLMKPGYVNVIR